MRDDAARTIDSGNAKHTREAVTRHVAHEHSAGDNSARCDDVHTTTAEHKDGEEHGGLHPSSFRCAARQKIQQRTPTIASGTTAEARMIRFRTVTPELPSSVSTDRAYVEEKRPGRQDRAFSRKESVALASDPVASKVAAPHETTPELPLTRVSVGGGGRLTLDRGTSHHPETVYGVPGFGSPSFFTAWCCWA